MRRRVRKSPKRWESPYVAMITAAAERMLFWRRVKSDWPFLKSCRMCDITSAIRKLRADKRKRGQNLKVRNTLRAVVAKMRRKPTAKNLAEVYKEADRAAKTNVIAKNKSSRLKSRLSKLLLRKK